MVTGAAASAEAPAGWTVDLVEAGAKAPAIAVTEAAASAEAPAGWTVDGRVIVTDNA